LTSSSLNGLIIASIFFMSAYSLPSQARQRQIIIAESPFPHNHRKRQ